VQGVQLAEERQTPSLIAFKPGQCYSKAQAKSVLAKYVYLRLGTDDQAVVRETKAAMEWRW
jgi:hypothetical protein